MSPAATVCTACHLHRPCGWLPPRHLHLKRTQQQVEDALLPSPACAHPFTPPHVGPSSPADARPHNPAHTCPSPRAHASPLPFAGGIETPANPQLLQKPTDQHHHLAHQQLLLQQHQQQRDGSVPAGAAVEADAVVKDGVAGCGGPTECAASRSPGGTSSSYPAKHPGLLSASSGRGGGSGLSDHGDHAAVCGGSSGLVGGCGEGSGCRSAVVEGEGAAFEAEGVAMEGESTATWGGAAAKREECAAEGRGGAATEAEGAAAGKESGAAEGEGAAAGTGSAAAEGQSAAAEGESTGDLDGGRVGREAGEGRGEVEGVQKLEVGWHDGASMRQDFELCGRGGSFWWQWVQATRL